MAEPEEGADSGACTVVPTGRRQLRVFVASSFQDMAMERSLLAESAFPRLRVACAARGVAFTDVDLRWGIEAGAAGADVVAACLSEASGDDDRVWKTGTETIVLHLQVYRCRPYMIVLVGQRYGWQPDAVSE